MYYILTRVLHSGNMSARVLQMVDMTPKAKEGNRLRVNRWRAKNRKKYNEYMKAYRKKH